MNASLEPRSWRLKVVYTVLALDIFLTTLFFIVQANTTAELRRTQVILRETQIATCVDDNTRAKAIREKETALLRQQQEGLKQLESIPGLNTDYVRKLARKNYEDTIAIRARELEAFPITECPAS